MNNVPETEEEYHMRVFGFYKKPPPLPPTEEEIAKREKEAEEKRAKWRAEKEAERKELYRPKPKRADFRFKGRRLYFYDSETTSMWTGEYEYFRISYVKDFVTDEEFYAEDVYEGQEWEDYLEVFFKAEMRIFGPVNCAPYDCDNVW